MPAASLPLTGFRRSASLITLLLTLTACGGGGGGGGGNQNPPPTTPPPPPAGVVSGVAMLGPVAGADVTVSGTGGVLGSGTTGSDGAFGPIEYDGAYNGPLRIEVSGNSSSTWICDVPLGCDFGGTSYNHGDAVPFDGSLQAVLSDATSGQFATVSMLSDMVARRTVVLGGLSAANVTDARNDIAAMLNVVLEGVLTTAGVEVPANFDSIPLFDPADPPAPTGTDDQLAAILSLFNSSLAGRGVEMQTSGEFIAAFNQAVAENPDLPVSAADFGSPSLDSLTSAFLDLVDNIGAFAGADIVALNALLQPSSLPELSDAAAAAQAALPSLAILRQNSSFDFYVNDALIGEPLIQEFVVETSTGSALAPADFDVVLHMTDSEDWMTADHRVEAGTALIRLELDNLKVAMLANGPHYALVEVVSTAGNFVSDTMPFTLFLDLQRELVDAGPDFTAEERAVVGLPGSTTRPTDVVAIRWTQLDGPTVDIDDPTLLQPTITLPSIANDAAAIFQLEITFTGGESSVDSIVVNIDAFPNIADQVFPDTALQQCIDDAAASGGLVETPELTSLSCSGVGSLTGIEVFTALTSIELTNNNLSSLAPLLGIDSLEFVDISGTPGLPCGEIDALAERLEEGVALLVHDICQGTIMLPLAASAADSAMDTVREQVYISLPDRREIAVVSTSDLRVVDRIALPGVPQGIDLGLDGTRLFVALSGSNSVAVVDIAQRTVTSLPLADSTGHPDTFDVVEATTDRLFVSASPNSGGFAYIAQLRLDQGVAASRAASQRIIRARPALARSPNGDAVYVGEGFSPNSLYKLNLLDPDAPIVLEDDHGSVSGTDYFALNASGTRIALTSGQVLRTGSFIEEGRVSPGIPATSESGTELLVGTVDGVVEVFDFDTLQATGSVETRCDAGTTTRLHPYGGDTSFALVQQDTACMYTTISRSQPPDPYAELRFTDLAFEQCVIDAANLNGFTTPAEFTVLDCSAAASNILSIEGIERFVNLVHLDLSNHTVLDLAPLAGVGTLQGLVLTNAGLSDVSPLLSLANLASADLTGNPGVTCNGYGDLEAAGVAVTADRCTDPVRLELAGIGADLALNAAGDTAYVSVPGLQQVVEIDVASSAIARTFSFSAQPQGIDLSTDEGTLFVALHGAGDMAALDLVTEVIDVVDLSQELDDDRTWDVAEVSADRILVSSNPGSSGFAYIVEVRRDLGDTATRVASNRIIRASPVIEVSPDGQSVYVGEGFSPNSLYKLDATQATLPIVAEDDHGQVSGTNNLAVSPDGSRVYLTSGQAIDTTTITPAAQFPQGLSTVTSDGTRLLIGNTEDDAAREFDTSTGAQTGSRQWGCDLLSLTALRELGAGVIVLGDDLVCLSREVNDP